MFRLTGHKIYRALRQASGPLPDLLNGLVSAGKSSPEIPWPMGIDGKSMVSGEDFPAETNPLTKRPRKITTVPAKISEELS